MALTVKQVAKALEATGGNVSEAARALGVHRTTVHRKIKSSETLQEIVTDARESLVDLAEGKIKSEIKKGNITAIIFTLKTQGKERGWVERHEVSGPDRGPIEITGLDTALKRVYGGGDE